LTKLYAVAEPSMPAPTTMTSNTSLLPSMTTVNCYNSVIDEQNRNRCMQWRDNDRQHYYSYFRCVLVNFLNWYHMQPGSQWHRRVHLTFFVTWFST
jgi:hypothetical protein